jgi:nitrogen-specific signal transduction histidine kinase/CheY-like chemotaxis protein
VDVRTRELREANDALRRSEEQLRQAQKLEAVGRLTGGIAHDFNNLLSVILSSSDLASADLSPDSPAQADLAEIRHAARRAADLTRQLLAFSRQQVLEPRNLDLNEVLFNLQKLLARVLGEDIELRMRLSPRLGTVKADPGQIEQVVMNLVVNARDAMPRGGMLTVETSNVYLDEAYARVHLEVEPGRYVLLAVSDTGVGMDKETQARAFDPFFTTKEQGKGTGLGLATVFGIVKQSGGNIWLYSEPAGGATFKIYLPRVQEAAETLSAIPVRRDARGTETILLAEDEPQVRAIARTILEKAGYRVLEATTPADALAISDQTDLIDLLLTDVIMPKISGRELAERITKRRPSLKTLFMSGYTDDAVVLHGVLEAGVFFLQKPFTPDSLARKVRDVLDAEANPD